VLAWPERPDVRLVECAEGWSYPRSGAARFADLLARMDVAPQATASHQRDKTTPQETDSRGIIGR
jgi:DNA polymerase-3 subunit epsilon